MKIAFWVLAAGLAVTASAMAWRDAPAPVDSAEPAAPAAPAKKRRARYPMAAFPAPSALATPIRNATFQPTPRLAIVDEPVLAQLPPDTLFVGAVDNMNDAMRAIDLKSLLEIHATEMGELEKALGGIPGVDALDPATWAAGGIDLDGPGGLAIIDFEKPVLVLFGEVKDLEAFDRAMDVVFGLRDQAKVARDVEGVSIITAATDDGEPVENPEIAIVIRGRRAFILARLDHDGDIAARAEEIALQDASTALISDPRVTGLVDALELGHDGVGYLNVRAMVAAGRTSLDRDIEEQQRAIDEARGQLGDNGEPKPTHEQPDTTWQESRIREMEATQTFLEALIGGVQGVGFGVELGAEQVEAEAVIALEDGSMLSQLVSTRSGLGLVRMALPESPLWLMDVALSPSVVRQMVQLGFTIADADYAQVMQLARAFGGFGEDPFDLVTGEVGFGLSRKKGVNDSFMPFDFVLTAGLRSPETVQKILNQVGGMATLAGWGTYVEATKGLEISGGYLPKIQFAVVGRSLVIATDTEAVARLTSGGQDVAGTMSSPGLIRHLPGPGQSFNWILDAGLFTADESRLDANAYNPWAVVDTDTAEMRTIKAELEKLEETLYRAPERKRRELDKRVSTGLGAWGLTVVPDEQGLRVRGGWYFDAPDVAAVFRMLAETDLERHDLWKTDEELSTRRQALVERLSALQAPPPMPMGVMPPVEYPVDLPQWEYPVEQPAGNLDNDLAPDLRSPYRYGEGPVDMDEAVPMLELDGVPMESAVPTDDGRGMSEIPADPDTPETIYFQF